MWVVLDLLFRHVVGTNQLVDSHVLVYNTLFIEVSKANIDFVLILLQDTLLEGLFSLRQSLHLTAEPALESGNVRLFISSQLELDWLGRIPELLHAGPHLLALVDGLAHVLWGCIKRFISIETTVEIGLLEIVELVAI